MTFVNDAGERENRYFVNVASFGMSTAVLERLRHEVLAAARHLIAESLSVAEAAGSAADRPAGENA